jgi:hypothetical protein
MKFPQINIKKPTSCKTWKVSQVPSLGAGFGIIIPQPQTKIVLVTSRTDLVKDEIFLVTATPKKLKNAMVNIAPIAAANVGP